MSRAVATIKDVDEYGPIIEWRQHWVELKGRTLYVDDLAQEKAEPVVWPRRLANVPAGDGSGDRIIGFRIPEGDPILGDYGLSEPLAWLRKVTIDRDVYTAPPAERVRVPADLHSVIPPEDRSPTAQQETYTAGYSNGCVVGWNSCRRATAGNIEMLKAKLSAAPEADHG